jgi:hypothetical protein
MDFEPASADLMETLAAAHAELGDFEEAVRWRAAALDAILDRSLAAAHEPERAGLQ